MKSQLFVLIAVLFSFTCTEQKQKQVIAGSFKEHGIVAKRGHKLAQLRLLPKDKPIDYLDLSNDSLNEFPDLSMYTIKSLNLSYNQLDSVLWEHLPKKLDKLDLSHNRLKGQFSIQHSHFMRLSNQQISYSRPTLGELYLQFNNLGKVCIEIPLRRLVLSDNNITHICLAFNGIKFMDISNNPHLSNEVAFDPNGVDTIIRHNIVNDKPLKFKGELEKISCF